MKSILICDFCLNRNYQFKKSIYSQKRLILNKYCRICNKKTKHKESK